MPKTKFELRENVYLALGLLFENEEPKLYLIPATVWQQPNEIFVEHNYDALDLKSKPEWGVNVSKKNMPAIEGFAFDAVVERLGS